MQIKEIVLKSTMDMARKQGSLEVFVEAEETQTSQGKVFLWAQLLDEQGEEADRIFPVELQEETQFCMEVQSPKLWNTEYPYLYELVLELRDEENRLLGCTSKMTGFYSISVEGETLLLNGANVSWRMAENKSKHWLESKERITEYLNSLKKEYVNCLIAEDESRTAELDERCVEYGILLLSKEESKFCCADDPHERGTHPDFEIQVVEDGTLIENKSQFINTNVYSLRCEILLGNRVLQQSMIEADVSAGNSRYLELPFIKPQNPGVYTYRVSLCLKKDTAWGKKGDVVTFGETLISNMWLG